MFVCTHIHTGIYISLAIHIYIYIYIYIYVFIHRTHTLASVSCVFRASADYLLAKYLPSASCLLNYC